MLIIQVEKASFTYRPRSDFLVLKHGLPRMAVEVNSHPPGSEPLDYYRLMLQGASIVRFANKFLDPHKEKKNFFFVTIFVSGSGTATRRILYQSSPNDRTVRTLYVINICCRCVVGLLQRTRIQPQEQ